MHTELRYNTYSEYLRNKYGEKVYKLPVNLPVTCPNRDGNLGRGGCSFCGEEGAGFENLSNSLSVYEQLQKNKKYIGKKYNAKKFIAYFQNYTNTYISLDKFKSVICEAIIDGVVEIAISTRPDCISVEYLTFLQNVKYKYNIEITVELGLQTVNYHSLSKVNRGHSLGEFIDAVINIKKYDLLTCTHLILNLPWDDMEDVMENAKVMSALKIDQVKLHSLYIIRNTPLGESYLKGEFNTISMEEYVERVIVFLAYLSPNITVQRLLGRAPKDRTLFANWDMSWWKIKEIIESEMEKRGISQGDKCNYLNGKAINNFL